MNIPKIDLATAKATIKAVPGKALNGVNSLGQETIALAKAGKALVSTSASTFAEKSGLAEKVLKPLAEKLKPATEWVKENAVKVKTAITETNVAKKIAEVAKDAAGKLGKVGINKQTAVGAAVIAAAISATAAIATAIKNKVEELKK